MKTSALLFATMTMAVLALPAQAGEADADYSQGYTACMDKAVSTMDMIECIGAEHKLQDARLNAAYKALRTDLSDARKTQLRDVQRLWLSYRDANCAFHDDPEGGSLARLSANQCQLDMTAQRALELERMRMP